MSLPAQKPVTTPIPVQLSDSEFAAFILPPLSCRSAVQSANSAIIASSTSMGALFRHNRKCIFNAGLIPNIPENPRNRKRPKRGRKRWFNTAIHALRAGSSGPLRGKISSSGSSYGSSASSSGTTA